MLKITYIKALWKYLSSIASTACHFQAFKNYAPKFKFDNLFRISDYTVQFKIQEIAFKLLQKILIYPTDSNYL